jgi:predicted metalloprotease
MRFAVSCRRLAVIGSTLAIGIGAIAMPASAYAAPEHLGSGDMDSLVEWNRTDLNTYWTSHAAANAAAADAFTQYTNQKIDSLNSLYPAGSQPAPRPAAAPTRPAFTPPGLTWVNEKGGTDTGCGLGQADDAVATGSFYCPKDGIVYMDNTRLRDADAQWGIPGILSSMAHEWGHHVQQQLEQAGLRDPKAFTGRQVELQADCMAGAYMHWIEKGNAQDGTMDRYADLPTLMDYFYALGDAPAPSGYTWTDAHGSPAERQSAFAKGWDLTDTPYTCAWITP